MATPPTNAIIRNIIINEGPLGMDKGSGGDGVKFGMESSMKFGMKFVRTSKYAAILENTTVGSALVQSSSRGSDITKWLLTKIVDNEFTIQSTVNDHYARVKNSPEGKKGDDVLLGLDPFPWTVIKNGDIENQYHIYCQCASESAPLFWSFADANEGTNVTLTDPNDASAEWIFEDDSGNPADVNKSSVL